MTIIKTQVFGRSFIGVFLRATNSYVLYPPSLRKAQLNEFKGVFKGSEFHSLTINNSKLLGIYTASNKNGILLPSILKDQEKKGLESFLDGNARVGILDSKENTLGNLILCNDHGAVISHLLRKYKDKMKPGVVFGAWLILAGVGRNIIEFFRPDQPTFPGTGFSYSRFVAILMIIAGALLMLIKYKVVKIGFIPAGRDEYKIDPPLEDRLEEKKEKGAKQKEGNQGDDRPKPKEDQS